MPMQGDRRGEGQRKDDKEQKEQRNGDGDVSGGRKKKKVNSLQNRHARHSTKMRACQENKKAEMEKDGKEEEGLKSEYTRVHTAVIPIPSFLHFFIRSFVHSFIHPSFLPFNQVTMF